uniref:ATP synthase subunit b n=1 Tax=Bradyrhizobium japonicum TaxID=375 RepID=Q9JMW1_BRAJP|nr:Fo ATP synthase B chain [Bradyrhizobium japonicum]
MRVPERLIEMFFDPETWVAIAFVILMVVFGYLGVFKSAMTALDHRAARIKAELDDATRLKQEAAKVLADYKARSATAEREAADIIANAKVEAERIATEAKAKMEDFVARRTKTAESKIALAEAQAVADVRARSRGSRRPGRLHDPVAVGARARSPTTCSPRASAKFGRS